MSFEDYANAVKIDKCHVDLIYGLIRSQKPESILELGFGSGESTKRIIDACVENSNEPHYLIIDNWMDFDGKMPDLARSLAMGSLPLSMIALNEKDFIEKCQDTFDFILSDADHCYSHLWFERTFNDILRPGGIMVCHDIMNREGYPRLYDIVINCKNRGISHVIFDKNGLPDERCERGLLVIFKQP